MKKTILILTFFAFIASGCNQKKNKVAAEQQTVEQQSEEQQTKKRIKYCYQIKEGQLVFLDDGTAYECVGEAKIDEDGFIIFDENMREFSTGTYNEWDDGNGISAKNNNLNFFDEQGLINPKWQIINFKNVNFTLEETILITIKAYQKQDEETLNNLILKDFGIAFVYRPGIFDVFDFSDKISFSEPLPNGWIFDTNIVTDYKIRFEKLPVFDCEEEKWNKPAGIYCDKKNKIETLSSIAKNLNEYSEGNFSAAQIKKFKEIEKKSHRVIVIGKKGYEFIFTVTFLENKWYLTVIERFEGCSA